MKWPSSSLLLVLIAAAAFGQTPSGESGPRSGSATSPTSALAPDACTPFAQVFCAHNERFWVSAIFSAPSLGISSAAATAVPITNDTGYFWFFSSNNVELVVKVVDGRVFNGYYWVFCAALSDLAYAVTVTDTETAVVKTYANAPGNLVSVADTAAFLGSTSTTCRYDVGPPIPATFGIGGGGGSVSVRTQSDCPWTAVSNSLFIYNVSPSSGTGSGTVQFSVAAMFGSLTRHGRLTVAGVTLEITQGP